jgi:hypothetical protein
MQGGAATAAAVSTAVPAFPTRLSAPSQQEHAVRGGVFPTRLSAPSQRGHAVRGGVQDSRQTGTCGRREP